MCKIIFIVLLILAIQYYRFKKFISNPQLLNSGVLVDKMYFPFNGQYTVDNKGVYSRLK